MRVWALSDVWRNFLQRKRLRGQGGGGGQAGSSGQGRLERVYVPGQGGSGPSQTTTGPNGLPAAGGSRPYGDVLATYDNAARASLERGALPPSLQNAVKRYFSTLSR